VGGEKIKPFTQIMISDADPNDVIHVVITEQPEAAGLPNIEGRLSGVDLRSLGNEVYLLSAKAKFITRDMERLVFHAGSNPDPYAVQTGLGFTVEDMIAGLFAVQELDGPGLTTTTFVTPILVLPTAAHSSVMWAAGPESAMAAHTQ
jgi:hypothetical protein